MNVKPFLSFCGRNFERIRLYMRWNVVNKETIAGNSLTGSERTFVCHLRDVMEFTGFLTFKFKFISCISQNLD